MTSATPLITGTDFITVGTKDFDAALAFYGGVLGLAESKRRRGPVRPGGGSSLGSLTKLSGTRVVLSPPSEADVPTLRELHSTPEVAAWWGAPADDFPFDDPDATRFTILCGGEIAGLIQFGEELEPDCRYAWIDIFVDPRRQRRGVASDAIATLVRHLTRNADITGLRSIPRSRTRPRSAATRSRAFGGSACWRRRGGTPPRGAGATPSSWSSSSGRPSRPRGRAVTMPSRRPTERLRPVSRRRAHEH